MIQIANWVANLFIFGLGVLFLGIGLVVIMLAFFKYCDRND